MRNYKTIIRSCLLYGMTVVTVASYPLTALASTDPSLVTEAPKSEAVTSEETPVSSESTPQDTTQGNGEVSPAVEQPQEAAPTIEATATPEVPAAEETSIQPTIVTPMPAQPDASGAETAPTTTNVTHDGRTGVTNNLTSRAQTGNTGVMSNTTGGSATSGDAAATTTIINTVHSTVQGDTAGVAHFTADLHGNVVGDITLSPVLEEALADRQNSPSTTTTVQANQGSNLTNNISLGATSGNADVINNTTAGNATTGTADTVANIINLINTIIAANQSFVGTINIYGNLDGDILVSPDFIPQLLASNAPNAAGSQETLSTLGVVDAQSIVNNVTLNAATGSANVLGNTTAGNATTGTAATNLTILNYTGHEVVASNSLLIFVNVLGQWVGLIVDAPVGATAAVLGNGVTSNTAKQVVDADTTSSITNNIDLTSLSGDATVAGNTTAGSATSGDATASANIANISTTFFSLSDWFGILFINVFGTWHGSFGVNTANGTVIPITNSSIPLMSAPPASVPASAPSVPQFGFIPRHASAPSRGGMVATTMSTPTEVAASEEGEEVSLLSNAPSESLQPLTREAEAPAALAGAPRPNIAIAAMIVAGLIGAALIAGAFLLRR